jgi:hypothetical protein
MNVGRPCGRTGLGWVARQCVAAVLIGFALTACGSGDHGTGAPLASAQLGSNTANPTAAPATEICSKRFRHTTVAMMTTLRRAFARGKPYPGEIFGSSSYPPDSPAVQCLVPAGKNNYNVEVIVLSDGAVLLAGSQPMGNTFMTRP